MAKPLSAKIVVKILCKEFGFYFVSQKGSHVKLKKVENKEEITTIIPMSQTIYHQNIKGILDLAKIEEKDFRKKL